MKKNIVWLRLPNLLISQGPQKMHKARINWKNHRLLIKKVINFKNCQNQWFIFFFNAFSRTLLGIFYSRPCTLWFLGLLIKNPKLKSINLRWQIQYGEPKCKKITRCECNPVVRVFFWIADYESKLNNQEFKMSDPNSGKNWGKLVGVDETGY